MAWRKTFTDFVVKYDPNKDTARDLTLRIFYSVFIGRIKSKKPVVMFISGDSGEGKSFTGLSFEEILLTVQGMDLMPYVNDINVYTPLQYPEKIDSLLFDKRLKKVNIICVHEAREVVKAKDWQSFLSQSIADINATSRRIKPLIIMIISQFIRDITTDIRYTLNYYITIKRPKRHHARAYINVMWKDDRDLEKPKLRKRKLQGYLIYPNGKRKRFVPSFLELRKPPKEIVDIFEKADYESKVGIIKNKINKLIAEMKASAGEQSNKVITMVEWYVKHQENIALIGKRYRNKFKVKKQFREMHELTKEETKLFEEQLGERLKEKGIIA